MNPSLILVAGALGLFVAMLVFSRLGCAFGDRFRRERGEDGFSGIGTVDGALFALFGLLIAFTYSGAYGRFETRRDLIVAEANAIGTAWLRIDLVPSEAQTAMRETFREYVDSRIETWNKLADQPAADAELARTAVLQTRLWSLGVAATGDSQSARILLLPALNDVIDITTSRLAAWRAHVPLPVTVILLVLALACAWCMGFEQAQSERPSRLHPMIFAAVTTVVIYLTYDIEYPRIGFVQLDDENQMLVEVRRTMD